jgi:hypothetical protein
MVLALYATVVPGLGDARLLVTDLQATSQVRVVHEAPELAPEAAVVDGVEAHRVAEKARSALSSFAAAREKAGSSLGTGFEVTVADEKVDLGPTGAPFLQVPHKVFHNYNGTVPAAGAAYAQGEVRLAFGGVAGDEEGKQLAQVGEELYGVLLAQHRRPNRLVVAG